MQIRPSHAVVLVTAPNLKVARRLAGAVLGARLAACVNLVPSLESHFWWKGKIEHSREVLMIVKTTRRQLRALHDLVIELHPYDTAEFVALPMSAASRRYLAWINDAAGS